MDRLAVPAALIIVIGLVAVLVGAPLVPGFTVPGAAQLGAALTTVPDALNGLVAPTTVQDVDLTALLAACEGHTHAGLPPGPVGRWAGGMEVYVPAPEYLAVYPVLPGSEKAPVAVEVDRPASGTLSGKGGQGSDGAPGGTVTYHGD